MTVAELREWLATQDQEATVEIVAHTGNMEYLGDTFGVREFDPEEHVDYTDLRGNQFVKEDDPRFGSRSLLLGLMP